MNKILVLKVLCVVGCNLFFLSARRVLPVQFSLDILTLTAISREVGIQCFLVSVEEDCGPNGLKDLLNTVTVLDFSTMSIFVLVCIIQLH